MPPRILIPFDDSEPAREALEYAVDLFPDGEFVALTVVDVTTMAFIPNSATDAQARDRLEKLFGESDESNSVDVHLQTAESLANELGVDLETRMRLGSPTQEIVEFAETESIDHVVIGSRGRSGMRRVVLGSVAEVVVRHSPVPVTVVR